MIKTGRGPTVGLGVPRCDCGYNENQVSAPKKNGRDLGIGQWKTRSPQAARRPPFVTVRTNYAIDIRRIFALYSPVRSGQILW